MRLACRVQVFAGLRILFASSIRLTKRSISELRSKSARPLLSESRQTEQLSRLLGLRRNRNPSSEQARLIEEQGISHDAKGPQIRLLCVAQLNKREKASSMLQYHHHETQSTTEGLPHPLGMLRASGWVIAEQDNIDSNPSTPFPRFQKIAKCFERMCRLLLLETAVTLPCLEMPP